MALAEPSAAVTLQTRLLQPLQRLTPPIKNVAGEVISQQQQPFELPRMINWSLGMTLPDPKHLGPLLLAWGFSILVMVRQKDLGSSLLFFALVAVVWFAKPKPGGAAGGGGDVGIFLGGALPVVYVGCARGAVVHGAGASCAV